MKLWEYKWAEDGEGMLTMLDLILVDRVSLNL